MHYIRADIKKTASETLVHVDVKVETLVLGENLHVFRKTVSRVIMQGENNSSVGIPEEITEGVVDDEYLPKLLAGNDFLKLPFIIVSNEILEEFRKVGWNQTFQNHKFVVGRKDVFTAFSTNEATMNNLVEINYGGRWIQDSQGTPRPIGVRFDYKNGNINGIRYDLRKLISHLKKRDDITFTQGSKMIPIPSDVENYGFWQLIFTWSPTDEDYAKMVEHHGSVDEVMNYHEVYKVASELDMLGLRACRI